MEILQGVLKQHLRPRAVVGYGVKVFLPSPPNYVTRSPGGFIGSEINSESAALIKCTKHKLKRPHCSADVSETSPRSSDDKQIVDVQPTSLAR